jgi:lysozyme
MTVYELIKKHEGERLKPYKCTANKWSIGVGWNFDDNKLPEDINKYLTEHGEITQEMSDRLLTISVGWAARDCRALFPEFDTFSGNRQIALIDWLFQLGHYRASKFTNSIHMINTGRWEAAAENMMKSKWAQQTPNRAREITKMIEEG